MQLFIHCIWWIFVEHLLCATLGAGDAEGRQSLRVQGVGHKLVVTSQCREWSDGGCWKCLGAGSSEWVKEGFWYEKGMEVRESRGQWGNHKEVRLPECKVQIWEWWAKRLKRETNPRVLLCLAGAFDLHPEDCRELLVEHMRSVRKKSSHC